MRFITILTALIAVSLIVPFCANSVGNKEPITQPMDTLQAKALRLRVEVEARVKTLEARVYQPRPQKMIVISARDGMPEGSRD